MSILSKITNSIKNSLLKGKTNEDKLEIKKVISDLNFKILCLEKEIEEKNQTINQMRKEYNRLIEEIKAVKTKREGDFAGNILSSIANRLSILVVLAYAIKNGAQTNANEIAEQVLGLEKELMDCGLEPIGRPGETVQYDVAIHQPMGNQLFEQGEKVIIRIPGYRVEKRILIKAYVSE